MEILGSHYLLLTTALQVCEETCAMRSESESSRLPPGGYSLVFTPPCPLKNQYVKE